MAGTTRLELATSAVTVQLDVETQALMRSSKERKVLQTHGREFLLFRIVPATEASDSETKIRGRIDTDAVNAGTLRKLCHNTIRLIHDCAWTKQFSGETPAREHRYPQTDNQQLPMGQQTTDRKGRKARAVKSCHERSSQTARFNSCWYSC
jgi:hypothetical protein